MADLEISREPINKADLRKLARIARAEREDFFSRHREYDLLYRRRILCAALCGNAALHYINGMTGVVAFEVWTFYAEHAEAAFPHRHEERYDFGASRFGRAPDAPTGYKGRIVVLTGRSIDASPIDDPVDVLQRYLRKSATGTPRQLAEKAVVLIDPEPLVGYVVWPTLVPARPSTVRAT